MCARGAVGWTGLPTKSGVRYFPSIQKLASKARRPNRVAYRTHPAPASRRRSASAASHTARSSHSPSAVARCRAHPRLPAFPLCRLCTGLRRSAGGGICARVPNHAPTRPPARSHAALSSPRPSAPRALALTPTSPPSVAQTVHCGTAHCRWLGRRPRDRMAEPSNESLVIERSLLELYEPNAHAAPMMAIDFLHDLARRSATMPSALSKDLLNRQKVTASLRLRTEAALLRVACTHADVRIEDNGHGAWLVSGLQPRANTAPRTTATAAPACPDGHARPLPSRSERSSRHPLGPKRARLANPEAEILPPGTRFHWKGRAYEIHDRHDRVQSTAAKQHCHLRRDCEGRIPPLVYIHTPVEPGSQPGSHGRQDHTCFMAHAPSSRSAAASTSKAARKSTSASAAPFAVTAATVLDSSGTVVGLPGEGLGFGFGFGFGLGLGLGLGSRVRGKA